jgi:hypothetical protein
MAQSQLRSRRHSHQTMTMTNNKKQNDDNEHDDRGFSDEACRCFLWQKKGIVWLLSAVVTVIY